MYLLYYYREVYFWTPDRLACPSCSLFIVSFIWSVLYSECPLFELSFIRSVLYLNCPLFGVSSVRFHCITMCLCIHIVIDVDFQQHHFYKPSHEEHNSRSASTKKSGNLPVKTPAAARSKDKTKIPQNRHTITRSHSLQASRYTRVHCNKFKPLF